MSFVYQVVNWDKNFENNKSRERDNCSYVCVKNKQHGLGFSRVVSEKDGAAIYGIWSMILGACSRQKNPREGWLTHDGHPTGTAWAPDDLAVQFRRPEEEIRRALEVLTSPKVGWMRRVEITDDGQLIAQVPAECPTNARLVPLNRIEEKRSIERERRAGDGDEIEPPPGFPSDDNAAVEHAAFVGCPREFAVEVWNECKGRGYRDRQNTVVRSFRNTLAAAWSRKAEWERRQSRSSNHVSSHAKPASSLSKPKSRDA